MYIHTRVRIFYIICTDASKVDIQRKWHWISAYDHYINNTVIILLKNKNYNNRVLLLFLLFGFPSVSFNSRSEICTHIRRAGFYCAALLDYY